MHNARGFTLIELLVTLVVAVILSTLAVPSFLTTIRNDRQVTEINSLLTALMLARSAAIKHGGQWTASVCAGASTSCSDTNWADGWVVFTTSPTGTAQIVEDFPAVASGNTLTTNGGSTYTFGSSGMLTDTGSDYYFVLCDSRGAPWARSLDLLPTGSVQSAQTQGYRIDGKTALTCPGP